MAHYAFLDENNVVTQVISGRSDYVEGIDWEKYKVKSKSMRVRPSGDIICDLEEPLMALSYDHDMQWYEVLSLVKTSLANSCKEGQEKIKGKNPVFYYGPKENLRKLKKKL